MDSKLCSNLLLNVDVSFTGKANYSLFHVVTVIIPETNLLFVRFGNSMIVAIIMLLF